MSRNFIVGFLHRLRPTAKIVAQFIGREITGPKPCAGLKSDYFKPRTRERQSRDTAGRATTD